MSAFGDPSILWGSAPAGVPAPSLPSATQPAFDALNAVCASLFGTPITYVAVDEVTFYPNAIEIDPSTLTEQFPDNTLLLFVDQKQFPFPATKGAQVEISAKTYSVFDVRIDAVGGVILVLQED
jgi:hypothetical protein